MSSGAPVPAISRTALLEFLQRHRLAVQATRAETTGVQAAVVGIAVTRDFELIFDTLTATRKADNLRRDARIAFVIGGVGEGEEETVQFEGIADSPKGPELESLQARYFETFPDGRERLTWPGITYFRARPHWIRYSNYRVTPPLIVELTGAELAELR
jgi:Pyridoxamine 5'-phosphate oxidase